MKNQFSNQQSKHTFFGKKTTTNDEELDDMYETPKKWFENIAEDPKSITPVTEQVLIELKEEAKKCHDTECANYNIKNTRTNSNHKFIQTIMSKGTVSDKIAAFTVSIQDNPVCTLETLRNLVNMVKVGKKNECTQVIDTLTELFLTSLLRTDHKLKPFHQRPLSQINELSSGNAITRRKILGTWYFEDQLKEVYTSFVLALNNVGHDTIDSNKEKAISSMYKLLAGNPEQEKNLLSYIVNKLGDPSQQVASKAIYCLSQLLYKHSNMQEVVLTEVEKLLFRPNISTKAQYYGLCFLSQFYLYPEAPEVAARLIEVYFSFFKACIKKGEVDSRMMSALLMGVNRAYPYAKLEIEKISGHIDTIYRVVHIANNFNIGLHALTLLYQVSDGTNNITDRFYSALYKKLADPKLFTTSQQAMVLNLLYKALLKDTEVERVKVFIKRLLELSLFMQPGFACGMLYLISQVILKKENVLALVLKQTRISDDDDEDDEERYHDVKEENGDEQKDETVSEQKNDNEAEDDVKPDVEELDKNAKPGWHHCKINGSRKVTGYNPLSRNPLYAGGEHCAYTELISLKNHFHPSVALFANQILEGQSVKYSGDPLKDFTLIRFLDRFVFKNPKKLEDGSQGAHPTFGKRKNYIPKGVRALAVTSANYLNENLKNIPVDELFMHTYLLKKYGEKAEKDEEDDEDSDLESVQSEEFEDMLDKMAGVSKDDSEEDEDLDFMTEISENLKNKNQKKGKKRKDDEDINEDDDDDEEESDEDVPMDDDEDDLSGEDVDDEDDLDLNDDDKELLDDLDDDDEGDEDIEFGDESDEEEVKGKKGKKKKNDMDSLFANAEEFAAMLDDEGSSKVKPGSSNVFANKDNADMKQIDWEDKRNRWMSGYNKAIGIRKKNTKGNFGNKRPNNSNKFGNKSKKFKN